ncbi:MAG: hypothetical protein ACK5TQ_01280, partial [Acetobacteraceae bacterium]|nr:hypothetical protein [Roseomonas sp.]
MTAVSAVIFLVSARHNLAIAYCTVLILIMLAVVFCDGKRVGRAEIAHRAVARACAGGCAKIFVTCRNALA